MDHRILVAVCFVIFVLLIVNVIMNTKVYFVYSTGLGTILLMGTLIAGVILLIIRSIR
ncbi:hypothetical protein [Cytobacillus gottheilii]|uniref:Uncharacterized protein n=1 Tax=Cytobacillus gottheilii TaxID=859144 RepID=A0ABX8FHP8_9BACI|nr:hypothetical protein [Cytobacillus gottheilii]QVY63544.1 hypothetical protein J1899_11060 [Cytobacillus gottheilii]